MRLPYRRLISRTSPSRALAAKKSPHFVGILTPDILRRRRLTTEAADTTPRACTCGKTTFTPLNPWTHHPNTPRDAAIAPYLPTFPRRLLPEWYSCNWIECTDSHFLRIAEGWHDLSPARAIITHGFGVTGTIRPLAFCEATEPVLLFAADGSYFLYEGAPETLIRFGADFTSDEDFLARVTAENPVGFATCVYPVDYLPEDFFDKIHPRLDAEQLLKEWEVYGRRPYNMDLLDPEFPRVCQF
ncbi:hypothetical protein DFH09DRAFT_1151904 [Mycena vulgaris]|nr:hypothetical protein DFH09DRAFT_1151904 [Mycena vulgaris]